MRQSPKLDSKYKIGILVSFLCLLIFGGFLIKLFVYPKTQQKIKSGENVILEKIRKDYEEPLPLSREEILYLGKENLGNKLAAIGFAAQGLEPPFPLDLDFEINLRHCHWFAMALRRDYNVITGKEILEMAKNFDETDKNDYFRNIPSSILPYNQIFDYNFDYQSVFHQLSAQESEICSDRNFFDILSFYGWDTSREAVLGLKKCKFDRYEHSINRYCKFQCIVNGETNERLEANQNVLANDLKDKMVKFMENSKVHEIMSSRAFMTDFENIDYD